MSRPTRFAPLLAILLLTACLEDPYRVGVHMGPTGGSTAQMVESGINFSGGAGGRRLTVRVPLQRAVTAYEATPEMMALALDSIANDSSLVGIVTRLVDSVSLEAARKFEAAGVPYITATPMPSDFDRTHPHAFQLVPSTEEQAAFLVDHALKLHGGPHRPVIIYLDEDYGKRMARALTDELTRRGAAPVDTRSYSASVDGLNLQAIAEEVGVTKKPTVIFWAGRSPSLLEAFPTIRNRLDTIPVFGTDMMESYHVYGSPRAYTGLRFVRYQNPMSRDSVIDSFRARLMMWIGRDEITNEAMLTADAVRMIRDAINGGGVTRASLAEYLKGMGTANPAYNGMVGPIKFDARRRANLKMELAEVRWEGIVPAGTPAAVTTPPEDSLPADSAANTNRNN